MSADVPVPPAHVLALLDSAGPDALRTAAWLREQTNVVALRSSKDVPSESLANIYSARARRAHGAIGMKEAAAALRSHVGRVDLLWINTTGGFAAVFVRSEEPSILVTSFYVDKSRPSRPVPG